MILGLMKYLLYPLFQIPNPPSSAPASFAWLWWVIVVILIISGGVITLLSRSREEVQVTNEKRATSAEALVKTRDLEIGELKSRLDKSGSDCKELTSENDVLTGIKIGELMKFWEQKHEIELKIETLESELRRKTHLLKQYEEGTMK